MISSILSLPGLSPEIAPGVAPGGRGVGWIGPRRLGRRSGAARRRHAREMRAGITPGRAHIPPRAADREIRAAGAAAALPLARAASQALEAVPDLEARAFARYAAAAGLRTVALLAAGEAAPGAWGALKTPPPPCAAPAVRSRGRIHEKTLAHLSATVYRKDVIFKISTPGYKAPPRTNERGAIKGFSADSARRLRLLIRNTADLWTGFLTLTYPGDSFDYSPRGLDGREVKAHVNSFCQFLRRKKIAYVWILEFQERGAPHFHFLLAGFVDKKEIAKRWYEIVGSGDIRHLAAGTRVEAVKNPDHVGAYMGAYMTKLDQKTVPAGFLRVGRFWGASRVLSKTLFRMKGLYQDIARELRIWRRQNQGVRRLLADEQKAQAADRVAQAVGLEDSEPHRAKKLRRVAYACERRAQGFAKRWKWKGDGFVLMRGADAFRAFMRQAVVHDFGNDPATNWHYWDGKPDRRPDYQTPEQRIMSIGQFTLDGGFEPAFTNNPPSRKSRSNPV